VEQSTHLSLVHRAEQLMPALPESERLSWRDPDGFVVKLQGRIFRAVAPQKSEQIRALMNAPWMARLVGDGSITRTVEVLVPPPELQSSGQWLWLEHDALPFPCYPHEITALQLHDAGVLTLKVAIEAVRNGWMLKDASAWNVLYSGGRSVFVDWLSFDRQPLTGTWIAYGQFVRNFLLPLLLYRKLGITPPEVFLTYRDGITPERAYEWLSGLQLTSATALELVVLPKWLSRAGSRRIAVESTRKPRAVDPALAGELLLRTFVRLQGTLERLRPDRSRSESVWESYEEKRDHYSAADLAAKTEFVREHLKDATRILDLGCNAGEFSVLAAQNGKTVVASDADHPALSRLYQRLRGQALPITPILLNIGRPTPAVGWQNKEVSSFLDRSAGQFDCLLVLGLVHHILVSERVTLPMLAALLDRLDPKQVIIEWVDPKDPKFQQLAGLNAHLFSHLDVTTFEESLKERFQMVAKTPLPCGTRVMYLWCR
jgi:SAM-dependent methyltransferase